MEFKQNHIVSFGRIGALVLGALLAMSPLAAQVGSPPTQRSAIEDQDYTFCYGLFQDKLYQMAKEQLEVYIKKYPSSIRRQDALFLKAECSYFLGHYADAIPAYEALIREYPKAALTDDGFFRIGQSNLAIQRPVEAVQPFKTVLDRFPDSPLSGEAAYWLGEAYAAQPDRPNAIKYYTLSYEHFPANPYRDYALYAIGWTHQSDKKFELALASYRMLVDSLPASSLTSAARVRMAECRFGVEDFSGALKGLRAERARITAPHEAGQADYLIAESLERLKDHAGARDAYGHFLSSHPGHPLTDDGRYGLGWSLLQLKNYDSAAATFGTIVEGGGKLAPAAQYRLATAFRLKGDTAGALPAYRRVVELSPESEFADNALVDRAELLLQKGDTTGARTDAEQAIANYPSSEVRADALRILGESLLRAGDPLAARVRLREAAAIPGARFDVLVAAEYQAAWASFRAGRNHQAAEDFAAFIQRFPKHPRASEARYWQGESEYRHGAFDRSLPLYMAVAGEPGHAKRLDAMYGEGWSLYKLERYAEAAAAFDRLVQASPRGPFAYDARMRQADALFAMKEYVRAGQAYRTVLRAYPDSASNDYAAYQAAQASFRSNDMSEAYKQFADLVKRMPGSPLADDAQYAMGWVNFQRKEYTEAIKEFQKVTRSYPTGDAAPRAFYSLGDSYYNLQQYSAAEAAYRELIRRFPDSRYVADAMTGIQYCLVAQGKEKEAASVIDSYVKENPGTSTAKELELKKADLLYGQKNYAAASEAYRTYLQTGSEGKNKGQAYYWLGKSLTALGKNAEALAAYDAASTAEGRFGGMALLEAIDLALASGDDGGTLELIARGERSFATDAETFPEVLYRKGTLYQVNQNSVEARRQWEDVIRRAPGHRAADRSRLGLVRLALAEKQPVQARTLAQQVATSRTDELGAEAQFLVGEAWSAADDWKQATTAYLRVRYVFTSYQEWIHRAMLGLGQAYDRSGDKAKARETYRELIQRGPEAVLKAEAVRRLEALGA